MGSSGMDTDVHSLASAKRMPLLHRVGFRNLKLVTSFHVWPFMLISDVFVLLVMILLFCADLHSICRGSVYESFGEALKFTFAAAHKINVVSKSYTAYGPYTNRDVCVVDG